MPFKVEILALVLIFLSPNINAQNKILDFENRLDQALDDTTRIQNMCDLAFKLLYIDTDKAMNLAKESLGLSLETGNKKGHARAMQILALILSEQGEYEQAIDYAEQAIAVATEINDVLRVSYSNNTLGIVYKTIGENEKAIDHYRKAALDAERAEAFDFATTVKNNIGHVYLALNKYDSSRIYYYKALDRAIPQKDSANIQRTYNSIGIAYMEQGDFTAAFDFYFKSMKINEELDNQRALEFNWNNLGNAYFAIEEFDKSVDYHEKVLASRIDRNNKSGIANSYNNIGVCYLELGDYIKASKSFQNSIDINREIGSKTSLGNSLSNMGLTLHAQGLSEKAQSYFQEALKEHKTTGYQRGMGQSLVQLADIAFRQKRYRKAMKIATESLTIAKEIGSLQIEKDSYDWLAKSAGSLNQHAKSAAYYKAFIETSSALMDKEKVKTVARSIAKYDLSKKESVIASQSAEIKTLHEESNHERLRSNLFFALAILLGAVVLLFYFQFRQKSKFIKAKANLESNLSQMKHQMVSMELEVKERELRKYVSMVNEKNEIVDALQKEIASIKSKPISISPETYVELNHSIEHKLNREKDWEEFQKHFNQIHIGFLNSFVTKHGDLTANEMRLTALIRLNISNKEIAKLLNIEPNSVKKAKNRLRKKLDIDSTEALNSYIVRFS